MLYYNYCVFLIIQTCFPVGHTFTNKVKCCERYSLPSPTITNITLPTLHFIFITMYTLPLIEFMCHESGVVSLGYSRAKQRLFCGDRRGEVLIFDLRQMCLLQSLTVHSSAVNRIVVDDIDGFIATGSADGDIKVCVRGGCG